VFRWLRRSFTDSPVPMCHARLFALYYVCLFRTWGPPGRPEGTAGRTDTHRDTHAGTRREEFVGTPSLSLSGGAWNGATKPIIQSSGAVLQRGQEMCIKLAAKGSAPIATCLSTFVAGSTAFSLVQTVQRRGGNDIISSATTAPDNTQPALTVQDVPDAVRKVCGKCATSLCGQISSVWHSKGGGWCVAKDWHCTAAWTTHRRSITLVRPNPAPLPHFIHRRTAEHTGRGSTHACSSPPRVLAIPVRGGVKR
jgi:hypothetical protein